MSNNNYDEREYEENILWGLALAILPFFAWPLMFFPFINIAAGLLYFPGLVLSLILSYRGLNNLKKEKGKKGKGLARIAIILSYIQLVLLFFLILLIYYLFNYWEFT